MQIANNIKRTTWLVIHEDFVSYFYLECSRLFANDMVSLENTFLIQALKQKHWLIYSKLSVNLLCISFFIFVCQLLEINFKVFNRTNCGSVFSVTKLLLYPLHKVQYQKHECKGKSVYIFTISYQTIQLFLLDYI